MPGINRGRSIIPSEKYKRSNNNKASVDACNQKLSTISSFNFIR
jgi:hypothetical protein